MKRISTWLTSTVLALGAVGCIAEPAGSVVWGVNESDHDVVVTSALHTGSYVLPAHTWGKMFDSYASPSGDVSVFDGTCRLLAKVPLTEASETVHVPHDGDPTLTGRSPGVVPSGVYRAQGPGSGASFAPATCE